MDGYGRRIRAARGWAGLSQKALAERLGVDEQTIKRREADKQQPKEGELIAIAQICEVPLSFLFQGFAASAATTTQAPDETLQEIQAHRTTVTEAIGRTVTNHGVMIEKLDQNQRLIEQALAEIAEHRGTTEHVIAKRLVQHDEFTATVDEHREMMRRLYALGRRIEEMLTPPAGAQWDRAVSDLDALLPGEQPGSADDEPGSRPAQGGPGR